MNDLGEVVGRSRLRLTAAPRAFVWSAEDGMLDLNTLLDPSGQGWTLHSASAINNGGQILVAGTLNGQTALALLTPVPEPGAGGLAFVTAAAVLRRRRRRGRE